MPYPFLFPESPAATHAKMAVCLLQSVPSARQGLLGPFIIASPDRKFEGQARRVIAIAC